MTEEQVDLLAFGQSHRSIPQSNHEEHKSVFELDQVLSFMLLDVKLRDHAAVDEFRMFLKQKFNR